MRIRLLEDFGGYKKGEHDLPKDLAIEVISKGYAVVVKYIEVKTDKKAENALLSGKARDDFQERSTND